MTESTGTSPGPGAAAGPGTADPTSAGTGPYGPPPPAPRPPLRRSVSDRKLAGVAGGLGRYFAIDPLIFRVVLVTLAVFGGSGLLLYAIGWLLVPEDGENESEASRLINGRATAKIIGALILAVVSLVVIGNFARTGFGFGGFVALVAVGVAAYLISRSEHDRPVTPVVPTTTPPPAAPGEYGQSTGTAYATFASPAQQQYPQATYGAPPPPPPPYPPYGQPFPPPPPAPPKAKPARSVLGRVTVSVAALVVGLLIALNLSTTHDVPAEIVLACALGVVGVGLVVSAFVGRARGLIALGVVLVLATSLAGLSGPGLRGGTGDRSWAPRTVEGVRDTYRLGVGESRLDLSRVDFSGGRTVDVKIRQGVGHVIIVLPRGAAADVTADVKAGVITFPNGSDRNGTSVHRHLVSPRGTTDPTITIDAELGVGSLEVRRAF